MGLCDRITVLNFGQLIALGQPEILKSNLAVIEAYLGKDMVTRKYDEHGLHNLC